MAPSRTTACQWPGRRLAGLVAGLVLTAAVHGRAWSQAGITVTSTPAPSVVFGEVIVFEAEASSTEAITGVTLHLQAGDQPAFTWERVDFERGVEVAARATVDAATAALPPFSPVSYWWEFATAGGARLVTPPATFYYEDDRFDWQRLTSGGLSVHWYAGDTAFGQSALDVAVAAYTVANRDIRAPLPEHLDLYLYANTRDVQAALQRVGVAWADGHADVKLGVVIVVAAPDLSAEFNLRREIPHELTHILVYRATGERYPQVPAWLDEGLAAINQAQPEPDSAAVLAAARDAGEFLSFESLCGAFPASPEEARLAYAQSEGLTRYLRTRFGSERLHELLAAYAGGATCSGGVEAALGLPLEDLGQQWLEAEVIADPAPARWRLLRPWLLLAALVLVGPLTFFVLILPPARRARGSR
jgi:hypothetical protein